MDNIPDSQPPGEHARERTAFWGTSLRTMQKWLSDRVPVDDVPAMLRWVDAMPRKTQNKLTPAFRRRVAEERAKLERGAAAPLLDPLYAEFLRTQANTPPRDASLLTDLKREAAFAVFKLQRAQQRGDLPAIKEATETVRYISGVIHDEELRAQKLGKEVGDILPRPEVERILRALVYWLMRAVDELLAVLCKRLSAASSTGPLFPEEVRKIIEPELLSARLFRPFELASRLNAGTSLPRWTVEAMRDALAATLENAAAVFDQLHALPPPPPEPTFAGAGDGI